MALFHLGKLVATPGALRAIEVAGDDPIKFLTRHINGDWGDLDPHDKALNDKAVESGEDRIFSAYHLSDQTKIWIITEWDRSVTTILLPSEY